MTTQLRTLYQRYWTYRSLMTRSAQCQKTLKARAGRPHKFTVLSHFWRACWIPFTHISQAFSPYFVYHEVLERSLYFYGYFQAVRWGLRCKKRPQNSLASKTQHWWKEPEWTNRDQCVDQLGRHLDTTIYSSHLSIHINIYLDAWLLNQTVCSLLKSFWQRGRCCFLLSDASRFSACQRIFSRIFWRGGIKTALST